MGTDGQLRREAEAMPVVLSDEVKLTLLGWILTDAIHFVLNLDKTLKNV